MGVKADIIVVEDERVTALDLRQLLGAMGYGVPAAVATGSAAIEAAQRFRPDLILMDIHLEGEMDGIETADIIGRTLGIPVVYATAYADDATLRRAQLAGPYGYVIKPFDERELYVAIEIALDRHRMQRELLSEKRWFHGVVDSVTDAVLAVDNSGRVKYANAAAIRLLGLPDGRVMGSAIETIFRLGVKDGQHGDPHPVARVLETRGVVQDTDARLLDDDGYDTPVDFTCSPVIDDYGELLGASLVFRDVTERQRVEAELRRQAIQLEKTLSKQQEFDRLKDDFARNVSHELRTPLALVLGYAEMLAGGHLGALAPEQQDAMGVIRRRAHELHAIVEDLTMLVGSEMPDPLRGAADPVAVLETLLTEYRSKAHAAGLSLQEDVPADLDAVRGSDVHLYRIFGGLLSNAVKFTPPGGRVAVRGSRVNGHVIVEVEDTGIGFAEEEKERIFWRFYQIDGSSTRRYPGMGLGLAVVKETAEALGGSVQATSMLGQGSCFTVSLPVQRS